MKKKKKKKLKKKKYILENRDIKIINGRKLKEYSPKIKEQYKITRNLLQKKIYQKIYQAEIFIN